MDSSTVRIRHTPIFMRSDIELPTVQSTPISAPVNTIRKINIVINILSPVL